MKVRKVARHHGTGHPEAEARLLIRWVCMKCSSTAGLIEELSHRIMQEVRLHGLWEEGSRAQVVMSMGVGCGTRGFALVWASSGRSTGIFVMRQGLKRSHVFATCLVCSLLMPSGKLLGSRCRSHSGGINGAESLIAYGAGAFLFGYGIQDQIFDGPGRFRRGRRGLETVEDHGCRSRISPSSTHVSTSTHCS